MFRVEVDATERAKQSVQEIFAKAAVRVVNEEDIGERALAYPISKQERGHYTLYEIESDPQSVQGLYQAVGLLPDVLKCFIVRRKPLPAKSAAVRKAGP